MKVVKQLGLNIGGGGGGGQEQKNFTRRAYIKT